MGFMGTYYGGPSPFAAAMQQGVSGFMDAYTKMKGLGFEQQRVENEKARTELQKEELREAARHRSEMESMARQRLQNEQIGLEHQKLVTEEMRKGAERRAALQALWKEQSQRPTQGEFGEAMSLSDQAQQLRDFAAQVNAIEPGAGIPQLESALRLDQHQETITAHRSMDELRKAQIMDFMAQAEREKARVALQEEERQGVLKYLLENKDVIFKETGHKVTGKEPLALALKLLEISMKSKYNRIQEKQNAQQLKAVDDAIKHHESLIEKYMTWKPDITTPNKEEQMGAIAEKLQVLHKELDEKKAEREFLLTGKLPPRPAAPTAPRSQRFSLEQFTMDRLPDQMGPQGAATRRSYTGGMMNPMNQFFRGLSAMK